MATLGNPLVSFDQNSILRKHLNDEPVCFRLAYRWLASKLKGTAFKFAGVNIENTVNKQNAYLKDADPYEKQSPGAWVQGVTQVSTKWLNIWGQKQGLVFEPLPTSVLDCKEYFNQGYSSRSAIIGTFGLDPNKGNWAHATAYFAGDSKFFDANKGEFDLKIPSPGLALDSYHQYLGCDGYTLDTFVFFPLK